VNRPVVKPAITATSQELWQTEYDKSYCPPAEQGRPQNPVPPLESGNDLERNVQPEQKETSKGQSSNNQSKKKPVPRETGDGMHRFFPVIDGWSQPIVEPTVQAETGTEASASAGSLGSVSNRRVVGSNTSATLNSAEQATFVDSLDGSLGSTSVGNRCIPKAALGASSKAVSPRSSYAQPTIAANLKSKEMAATELKRQSRCKKFPARACYSLRATSSLSPPRNPANQSPSRAQKPTISTSGAVIRQNDGDSVEDAENVDSTNIGNVYPPSPRDHLQRPSFQFDPDRKLSLQQHWEKYDRPGDNKQQPPCSAPAAPEPVNIRADPAPVTCLRNPIVSADTCSAFEAPKSRRHYRTENSDNYDWSHRQWPSAAEQRIALNQKHKHHDILMDGSVDKKAGVSVNLSRPTPPTEFMREYCKLNEANTPCLRRSVPSSVDGKHVFGRASTKQAPLWVSGSKRLKQAEGCSNSQSSNNASVASADNNRKHRSVVREIKATVPLTNRTTSLNIDTAGDVDTTATVGPTTTGSFTIASVASGGQTDNNYEDSGSSITSVQAPTLPSSVNVIRETDTISRTSDISFGNKPRVTRTKTVKITRPAADTPSAHPPHCSCTVCIPKPQIPYSALHPAAATDILPRRHRFAVFLSSG
jgi:hypothetical protein